MNRKHFRALILLLCVSSCETRQASDYEVAMARLTFLPREQTRKVVDLRLVKHVKGKDGEVLAVRGKLGGVVPGRGLLFKDGKMFVGRESYRERRILESDFTDEAVPILGILHHTAGSAYLDPWIRPYYDF